MLNVEIKARCSDPSAIRECLLNKGADCKGIDEQTDTYFNVQHGRLKLREGNIENNLIYYERNDQAGPKHSNFQLIKVENSDDLKNVLTRSVGVKAIVHKRREIYYIDNVKFHIDDVPGLGSFVEVEAGNMLAPLSQKELEQQCNEYMQAFGIKPEHLVEVSYSDMMMEILNVK